MLYSQTHVSLSTRDLLSPVGYVPDGFTAAQWKQKQAKEKEDMKKKKFGAFGPQGFKSRSMQSFQSDLEKGKAGHLMPVFNAKEKVKKGQLKQEDIPYMQRGGGASWDNSDVKGAKKMDWNSKDKNYNANAKPGAVDWTGRNERQGPKQTGNKKPPPPQTKKLFGLF
jgi:hypothetical protein